MNRHTTPHRPSHGPSNELTAALGRIAELERKDKKRDESYKRLRRNVAIYVAVSTFMLGSILWYAQETRRMVEDWTHEASEQGNVRPMKLPGYWELFWHMVLSWQTISVVIVLAVVFGVRRVVHAHKKREERRRRRAQHITT